MKKNILLLALLSSLLLLTACGGGNSSSDTTSDKDADSSDIEGSILPSNNADYMSSYENSKTSIYINYDNLPITGHYLHDAIAYLDAEGDGDIDVFMGTGEWLLDGEVDSVFSINDGTDNFHASTSEFSDNMPPATHARKTLVSDFNGDGLKDMLILDHGYDSDPFPGSHAKLIIQDTLGKFSWTKLPEIGFYHSGAAGDIDNDGDIDIFMTDATPFFYINNGNATFTNNKVIFDNSEQVSIAELIDVDQDGFLDLLTGDNERYGVNTSIYWGSSTGKYSSSKRTILPVSSPMGALSSFHAEDIDGDGDRDLVINRTRDGDDGNGLVYGVGRTTQLLSNNGDRIFTDITSTNIDNPGGDTDEWFPWLRVQDFDGDGDIDIRPDNARLGFEYNNDGTGNFTKVFLD